MSSSKSQNSSENSPGPESTYAHTRYGSGDNNPGDETHHTFFQILPTPRVYARFPFFNMMNNKDLFGEVVLRPHKSLSLRTDVHSLALATRNDLWYQGGGAFQPWTFGYAGRPNNGRLGLATMFDVSADYQATPRFSVGIYFAVAQGGGVVESVYPKDKTARLGYVELNYRL